MFRVMTANLNGIRAATRKGFFEWFLTCDVDVLCVQETKAQVHQLTDEILAPNGYQSFFHDAQKKGYSGVAIYTRHEPLAVTSGLGWPVADDEGRYIQAEFEGLTVASIYMPSGTSGTERQAQKFDFLDRYEPKLIALQQAPNEFIICGDLNIAHKKIDIKNWRGNQKNSGFLPEERAWLDKLFDEIGFVDAFREINQEEDQYTWWSNRGNARANNVGWRIDYQCLTPGLQGKVLAAGIYKEQWFSDHAPLTIDYDLTL